MSKARIITALFSQLSSRTQGCSRLHHRLTNRVTGGFRWLIARCGRAVRQKQMQESGCRRPAERVLACARSWKEFALYGCGLFHRSCWVSTQFGLCSLINILNSMFHRVLVGPVMMAAAGIRLQASGRTRAGMHVRSEGPRGARRGAWATNLWPRAQINLVLKAGVVGQVGVRPGGPGSRAQGLGLGVQGTGSCGPGLGFQDWRCSFWGLGVGETFEPIERQDC